MRAALYCRVSTEDQTTDNQQLPLEKWAIDKGHAIDVFKETASGAKQNRTELGKLMDGVRKGDYKVVAVYKLDRLGRSLQHLLQIIEEFRNRHVQFVSLSESIDTETAQGRLFLQMAGAFAEYERELIRERTNSGLARALHEGKILGRPPGRKDKRPRKRSGYWLRHAKNIPPIK